MKETAADSIYRQVRNKIIKGEYDNTFLIERDIALEFSVSRAPVRDALQRLVQEGYLVSYARKGHLVNRISGDTLFQIQQFRFYMESMSLALIIKNASDEEISSLFDLADTENPPARTDDYLSGNTLFHTELAKLSKNKLLADAVYHYSGHASLAVFQNPLLIEKRPDYHREILNALLERDFKTAQKYLAMDMQIEVSTSDEFLLPFKTE